MGSSNVLVRKHKLLGAAMQLVVLFMAPLFGGAGTFAWRGGWLFLAAFFSFVAALTAWLFRHDPALLDERLTPVRADQKLWDKLLMGGMLGLFVSWLTLMGLDARRFRWSRVPLWLRVVGALLLLGSFAALFATFRENTYLSPTVRVQRDRGQRVVSSGPYAVVRHPMYAAVVVLLLGTALLLGSWWGLVAGAVVVVGIARRAVLEERVLADELPGYAEYIARVRYRFLPLLW
jgi:protein-S-isoprenylcysteine O-methyltransferase Ste14